MTGVSRAIFGAACFLTALLAVFRAPEYHLWMLALAVTEWGHGLAVLSLLSFYPGWRRSVGGRAGAALGLAAALLALTPLLRGNTRALEVPLEMERAFGSTTVTRPPFSWKRLILGVPTPAVRESAELFARSCGDELFLQLYRPNSVSRHLPVVIVVHGGSWQSGSRRELSDLSRYLASRGYAVASVDYGLAPRTVFPGPVEDIRDAIAFLRRHALEWSLDMDRVVLLGRSAGGQIALAAAHDAQPMPGIKGVVVFYAPNDLFFSWSVPGPKRIIDSRRLLRQYLGGSPAEEPERYAQASPLLRAGARSPATLMIHGGRDELVWSIHENRLAEKLKAAGVAHYYLDLPWATHGCDYNFRGPCGQISTYAIERFLAYSLR